MFELFDETPKINVQESEYKRLLGFPVDHVLTGRSKELAEQANDWYAQNGKPWIYACEVEKFDISNGAIKLNNVEFISQRFHKQLTQADAVSSMVVAVSAGPECEDYARKLWQENKPDEYFFMEIFGSAVVEHLVTCAAAYLCEWAETQKVAILPHYSPGYPGWDISQQNKLLSLIRKSSKVVIPEGLNVLTTGMLRPKKSLLAVFGITKNTAKVRQFSNLIPCETCSLPSCLYRRTAYKTTRWLVEDVSRLQSNSASDKNSDSKPEPVLTPNANYSISKHALEKWSSERLKLFILDDSSVVATFNFEGSTCSNLGHLLNYVYWVKLSSEADGYRIIDQKCNPAPGDYGHTYMCQFIGNAESLTNAIEKEKPLLGKQIDDVLNWGRTFTPSGCFCEKESRDYKWGLVLEIIHYALVQDKKQKRIELLKN